MSTKEKPNTELDEPEHVQTAEERYADPLERVVIGKKGGMIGFWRLMIPLILLLLAAGAFFATAI